MKWPRRSAKKPTSEKTSLTSARITFLVGTPPCALTTADAQWGTMLPQKRPSGADAPAAALESGITYGDYFNAVADFLMSQNMAVLSEISTRLLNRPVGARNIGLIRIHLVKHGAFYHPALVIWTADGHKLRMVLNVAVSPTGRKVLQEEYRALIRLNRHDGPNFVPHVFACGQGLSHPVKEPLGIFAGQWFTDFHELHVTLETGGPHQCWVAWHDRFGPTRLADKQVREFYRQAFYILTYYFNPFTFETILDWHHAAGDFVINLTTNPLQVRLITVRRFAPMFDLDGSHQPPDLQSMLDALVIFFLRTSMWMRIDRLDGVGDLVWVEASEPLASFIEGFADGLAAMARLHDLPEEFGTAVLDYLAAHPAGELTQVAERIFGLHAPPCAEKELIGKHLDDHIAQLSAPLARKSARKTGLFY